MIPFNIRMRDWTCRVALALVACGAIAAPAQAQEARPNPTVWMSPPSVENGRSLRELFEHPDSWRRTRSAIDVLSYADHLLHKQFTDDELRAWLPKLQEWGIKLSLEVGAIKPWGATGEKTFNLQRPQWDRVQRLGGSIYAIAMDEPLISARKDLKQPDEYAVEETARFIALARQQYPQVLIGDIEAYPFLSLSDLTGWIDALEKRLAAMGVRGLDFFRLDVDWVTFTVRNQGSWKDVKKLEQFCRSHKIVFSLIYWASDYPALERRRLADDSTWYVSIMQQGYDYALVDGSPDQFVVQSWLNAPSRLLPETDEFTFTRSVLDFSRKFAKRAE
jgi:hypothetical protein